MTIPNGPLWCLVLCIVVLLATATTELNESDERKNIPSVLDFLKKQSTNYDDDDDDDDDNDIDDSASSARYIRSIYESIANGTTDDSESSSDLIMTYARMLDHDDDNDYNDDNAATNQLYFDISKTPIISGVVRAELRFYSDGSALDRDRRVSVYHLDRGASQGWKFIDVVRLEANHRGWLTIDVSDYLEKCAMIDRERKLAFRLKLTARAGRRSLLRSMSRRAFVVAYYKSPTGSGPIRLADRRSKRSSEPPLPESSALRGRKKSAGRCRLHQLHVSFRDLELHQHVVAPEGFEAGYCAGTCNFPLGSDANASNHALVQTMMHVLAPAKAPAATCCAPTSYADVAVLVLNDANTHTIKRYPQMRALECACQ